MINLTDTNGLWQGRYDSDDPLDLRWHQQSRCITHESLHELKGRWILAGFQCDEGVRRNQGRPGARKGPIQIRAAASSYPVFDDKFEINDLGDIVCVENKLEEAQYRLEHLVNEIHKSGNKSLLLGGGHEISYPHYNGLKKSYPDARIGIINFDAHFDLRPVMDSIGPTSGTGFWQIAQQDDNFRYMVIGLQKRGNTKRLFEMASEYNVEMITQENLVETDTTILNKMIDDYVESVDYLYVTICMDVFSVAYAPGVSAPSHNGLIPDHRFIGMLRKLRHSGKVIGFDIAEVNPDYDIDNRTSKLAASFMFDWLT